MVNIDFINEKINLITRDLEMLERFSRLSFDEAAKDSVNYAAVKNFLMEIIGRAIDINEHLIVEIAPPQTNVPKSYRETFLVLSDLRILPKEFSEEISKSASFRNAIVHEYNNLDKGIIYQTVGDAVKQYSIYCKHIFNFLKKQ